MRLVVRVPVDEACYFRSPVSPHESRKIINFTETLRRREVVGFGDFSAAETVDMGSERWELISVTDDFGDGGDTRGLYFGNGRMRLV